MQPGGQARPDAAGLGGTPTPADLMMTLVMLVPGYVILRPSQSAVAPLSWRSWCGQQAANRAQVAGEGMAVADLHGPVQPECCSAMPAACLPRFPCDREGTRPPSAANRVHELTLRCRQGVF